MQVLNIESTLMTYASGTQQYQPQGQKHMHWYQGQHCLPAL